jgi:hypothetical protein
VILFCCATEGEYSDNLVRINTATAVDTEVGPSGVGTYQTGPTATPGAVSVGGVGSARSARAGSQRRSCPPTPARPGGWQVL